jgi:UDPglucose 6-dehydrogenase
MYKVTVLGLGYVGLTMAAFLADRGFETRAVDTDIKKTICVRSGKSPIHEPFLKELIAKGLKAGTLKVTESVGSALEDSDIVFVAVGTPSQPDGSIGLEQVKSASESVGKVLKDTRGFHLVVVRSTVIPGTNEQVVKPILERTSGKSCGVDIGLCANPEFLCEGSAVQGMLRPGRIVIGEYDEKSGSMLEDFYRHLYSDDMPKLVRTNLSNAELIKYVNNAFLATKVSLINSIANLCEMIPGSDVEVVANAIGLDPRIGSLFLKAGLGWGGSCFPKDLKAIVAFTRKLGIELPIVDAALRINELQPALSVEKAKMLLGGLKGKRIGILGLAFKPDTDDIREAVSIRIIEKLRDEGAEVRAYDPAAMENARRMFQGNLFLARSAQECIEGTDCCILVTEWEEFKRLKPEDFKARMHRPILIDGRRLYDAQTFAEKLQYYAVGLGKEPE